MENVRECDIKKPTPGPWKRYDGYGADFRKPVIVDSIPDQDGKCMANCICYVATTNPDFDANARLIALAPDLLGAVIELSEVVTMLGGPISMRIEMLIEQARGAMKQ